MVKWRKGGKATRYCPPLFWLWVMSLIIIIMVTLCQLPNTKTEPPLSYTLKNKSFTLKMLQGLQSLL